MPTPYPWLEQNWQRLLGMRARLPHAVLLAGPRGIGKLELANAWSKSLLCEHPSHDGDACGTCEACHWFGAGTHPDFMHLTLLEKENRDGEVRQATEISVEQSRQAVEFVQLSTYRAGRRLVLIEPAEALNNASANALLKVLEEPPLNTLFLLISHQPRQLLPTIISRCYKIEIGLPSQSGLLSWLQAHDLDEPTLAWASGAPLAALETRESGNMDLRRELTEALSDPDSLDAISLAESWNRRIPARIWYATCYKWLADLLACHLGGKAQFNPDCAKGLQKLAQRLNLETLLDFLRQESEAGRSVDHPLNRQMVMEAWLIRYRSVFQWRAS